MESNQTGLSNHLPYKGCCVFLTTKHQKANALSPPFASILGAHVREYVVDTDQLGTFTGEIPRKGTALDAVIKKCRMSIENLNAEFAVASEGSFGPHPVLAFMPADFEVLHFIDTRRDFHLNMTHYSTKTNYNMCSVSSVEQLLEFARKTLFPSHALVVRPDGDDVKSPVFKGLLTVADLEAAFHESVKFSPKKMAWVETDMRAHCNPTRMDVIRELAEAMAVRLNCLCVHCGTPGWGKIKAVEGLPCRWCGSETRDIKYEVYGCQKCDYQQQRPPPHEQETADPGNCLYCNP